MRIEKMIGRRNGEDGQATIICCACSHKWECDYDHGAWLVISGQKFWCPACGQNQSFHNGSMNYARKEYIYLARRLRITEQWARVIEAERNALRRRVAGYKGALSMLRRKLGRGS